MPKLGSVVPIDTIESRIFIIRSQRVMLDRDLAALYGVETKALKQAVRRNALRFPHDFMFVLTREEFDNWRSQFVTSNSDRMGLRHAPMAFTEQGVAMLSSVLHSTRAIEMNIAIMRTFVRIRQAVASHAELSAVLKKLEEHVGEHDVQIRAIFEVINELLSTPEPEKKRIGF